MAWLRRNGGCSGRVSGEPVSDPLPVLGQSPRTRTQRDVDCRSDTFHRIGPGGDIRRSSAARCNLCSHPGEHQSGTAATFEEARADFESAWQVFLSKRTEADFQAWRHQRDWTARKYALWDAGKRLPPNEWEPGKPCSIYLKCP